MSNDGKNFKSDLVDIEVGYRFERDKSLAVVNERGNLVFLPKSLIEFEVLPRGNLVRVTLPRWLAEDKELC